MPGPPWNNFIRYNGELVPMGSLLCVSTIREAVEYRQELNRVSMNEIQRTVSVDLQAEVLESYLDGVTERWQVLHSGELVNWPTFPQTSSLNTHQNLEGVSLPLPDQETKRLKDNAVPPGELNEKTYAKTQPLLTVGAHLVLLPISSWCAGAILRNCGRELFLCVSRLFCVTEEIKD